MTRRQLLPVVIFSWNIWFNEIREGAQASQQHPGHILVTMVADPAEILLSGTTMAEIDEVS